MSIIETIAAAGLKARKFNHKLGRLNVIAGPNDSGKTAITDAVRLALLGYLPEHGEKNAATFRLAAGSKLIVEATIGETRVTREWAAKGKSVKLTETGTEGLAATPLVTLNAGEYFGAGPTARVQMLFALLRVDPDKFKVEKLSADILAKVREVTDPKDLPELLTVKDAPNVQAWLDGATEAVDGKLSEAKATAKRMEQTTQGLSELALKETPVDPARVERDMADAQTKLATLNRDHATLTEQAKQVAKAHQRRTELDAQIAQLSARIGERPLPENGDALTAELAAAEQERGKIAAEYDAAKKAFDAAQAKLNRRQAAETELTEKRRIAAGLADAQRNVTTLEKQLEGLGERVDVDTAARAAEAARTAVALIEGKQRELDARVAAEAKEHGRLMQATQCPTCGCAGDAWKTTLQARHDEATREFQAQGRTIATEFATAKEKERAATDAHSRALGTERESQRLERELGNARLCVATARAADEAVTALERELAALPAADIQPPEIPARLNELAALVDRLRDDEARLKCADTRKRLEEERAAIVVPAEDPSEKAARVEMEIESLEDRVDELKAQAQRAANQLADQKRLVDAQTEREAELVNIQRLTAAQKELKATREMLVNATLKPLLEVANVFTAGILPTPLEFREGEIGRFNGASWVPVECFGGTFEAVTYAGISAALGASAPAKVVIVDEMGRFDSKNKATFLDNVNAALERGQIEQFIGVDVDPAPYRGDSRLTLIETAAI